MGEDRLRNNDVKVYSGVKGNERNTVLALGTIALTVISVVGILLINKNKGE